MLEQPFPMSSALRATTRSLGFLMGYKFSGNLTSDFELLRVNEVTRYAHYLVKACLKSRTLIRAKFATADSVSVPVHAK